MRSAASARPGLSARGRIFTICKAAFTPYDSGLVLSRAKTAIVDEKKKSHLDSNRTVDEALTAIEGEILKLVVEGKSNAKVAALLGLSPRTVETYRARLMRKLGVDNLPDLVKYAIRHGITPLD